MRIASSFHHRPSHHRTTIIKKEEQKSGFIFSSQPTQPPTEPQTTHPLFVVFPTLFSSSPTRRRLSSSSTTSLDLIMGQHTSFVKKSPVEIVNIQIGDGKNNKKVIPHAFDKRAVELMAIMMPNWYTIEKLTEEDITVAKTAWNLILTDTSEEFLQLKGKEGFPYHSAVVWFFDTFYQRLYDIHPSVRPLLKNGLVTQGRFLVKMISLLLSNLDREEEFDDTLYKLVVTHNSKGIKAAEYGLVGEIIFYTMRKCIGPAYTVAVSKAWIKVVSRMLKTIIPKAIALELSTDSDAQNVRIRSMSQQEEESEVQETEKKKILGNIDDNSCPFSHDSVGNQMTDDRKAILQSSKSSK